MIDQFFPVQLVPLLHLMIQLTGHNQQLFQQTRLKIFDYLNSNIRVESQSYIAMLGGLTHLEFAKNTPQWPKEGRPMSLSELMFLRLLFRIQVSDSPVTQRKDKYAQLMHKL